MSKKTKNTIQKVKKKAVKTASNVGEAVVSSPKTTLYVVGGIVGLFVLYNIMKSVNNVFNAKTDPAGVDLNLNTTNTTITQEQSRGYASQLLTAMNRYGTDEDLIALVFDQLVTPDDVKLVITDFGLQPYNGVGLPPEGLPAWLDGATPMNLIGWLTEEISRSSNVYKKIQPQLVNAGFII